MVEKLEGTGPAYDLPNDDREVSGVRENPWALHLRALEVCPDREARERFAGIVAQIGEPVLARFPLLTSKDHDAVISAAVDRLARLPEPARCALVEERIAHAVLCEAVPVDLRRWAGTLDVPAAEVARDLAFAARRAAALAGKERSVFAAVCALDDAATVDEEGKVVLRAAVAFQMRWNTAHQNVSRAWRRICEGTRLGAWSSSFRPAHRYVCGPTSFDRWQAGRAYMDACSGRDGQGGDAFDEWLEAHEEHNAWFCEWKNTTAHASRRWRLTAQVLDAAGVRPGELAAPLVQGSKALGIDRWVIPAKLAQQSWVELLGPVNRPGPAARSAWLAFLREHRLGAEAEAAFLVLERDAALADAASAEVENAYRHLLAAAERQSSATLGTRDAFRALIEAPSPSPPPVEGACRRDPP
jgi:hypothetical protein